MMAEKRMYKYMYICDRLNRNYLYSPSTLFGIFPTQVRQLMIVTISSWPLTKYNIFYRFDNLVKKSLW